MSQYASKYAFELWSPTGVFLGDLGGRALNRQIIKSRNEADEITFTLDLDVFEKYAAANYLDPHTLLRVNWTEIRVKRGSNYIAAGRLKFANVTLDPQRNTIECRAFGFLNLLGDRFTAASRIFTATDRSTIASTLITETQGLTNGDLGITIGALAAVGTSNITYQYTNLKQALQDLSSLSTGSFDMEFTAAKVFNTYARIGSTRSDIVFEYPNNIMSAHIPLDGTHMANQIIGLGAGIGADSTLSLVVNNTSSQQSLYLAQDVVSYNSLITNEMLTNATNADLNARALPTEIPNIKVDANKPPYISDYGIGDFVHTRIKNHPYLNELDTMLRVEKYTLMIDNDDNEVADLMLDYS